MRLSTQNDNLNLVFGEKTIFCHSKSNPFVTALTSTLKYKSTHGTFTVKEKLSNVLPLCDFKIISSSDTKAEIEFSQKDKKMLMTIVETDNQLNFTFDTNCSGVEFNFKAYQDEAIFGGGEQFRQLNLKGEKIENFVSEHIKVLPIVQKTIFGFIPYKPKKASEIETYAPMSTFVSSNHYAIRVDADSHGIQDFSNADKTLLRYEKCPKGIAIFVADSFKEIGKKMAIDQKNNQRLPDWCYDGMILGVQGGFDKVISVADQLLDAGAKVNGVWCQDWSGKKVTAVGRQVYWNWIVDNNDYPNFKENIAKLRAKGVHFLAYINPYLVADGTLYNYCKENDMLIKNKKGEVYHIVATTFKAGMMDLTNPKMVEYLKEVIIKQNMLDNGVDGYMADFGEYLPVDCVLHSGDPEIMHNIWPTLWAKINREAIDSHERAQDVFFFTRSGYNRCQEYTTTMWTGDQHTDFAVDYGMPCIMPATFNLGFSGLTVAHSDVGGFTSFRSLARDAEITVRWMEMNTFSPLLRGHETIRPAFNAQYHDKDVIEYTTKFSNIHAKLKPYLQDCHQEAVTGVPFMRPDFYNDNDFALHKDVYSYFVGDDMFVAPVIEKGVATRKVNLPQGEWIHLLTKKEYNGSFVIDAPLGTPAVFVRKNSKYNDLFMSI